MNDLLLSHDDRGTLSECADAARCPQGDGTRGEAGDKGPPGRPGRPGAPGLSGTDGTVLGGHKGHRGLPGDDGIAGYHGVPGTPGRPGERWLTASLRPSVFNLDPVMQNSASQGFDLFFTPSIPLDLASLYSNMQKQRNANEH